MMASKIELETVARVLSTLNYYQVLKVSALAQPNEIRDAFHREAQRFHPDRYFDAQDAELLELAKKIYAQITDAYRTLMDPARREAYDRSLAQPEVTGSTPIPHKDENEITAVRKKTSTSGTSPGMRFLKLAQSAYAMGDLSSAKMNIQIALNADPNDPDILYLSQKIEADVKRGKAR